VAFVVSAAVGLLMLILLTRLMVIDF